MRVIVHTGNGRAFQTGVDVSELADDGVGMERYRTSVEDFDLHFTAWHQQVWKPVITAVNGICAGGGFHWVADADIVIAASDAQFFDPHVSVGQVVSLEAIALIRKMPAEAVMRMAFVGRYERMPATRALQLGMISEIVDPPERLRERAQELGETIARNSPAAMAATKKALWAALEHGLTDACKVGAEHLVSMWGHPDQEEGPGLSDSAIRSGPARMSINLASPDRPPVRGRRVPAAPRRPARSPGARPDAARGVANVWAPLHVAPVSCRVPTVPCSSTTWWACGGRRRARAVNNRRPRPMSRRRCAPRVLSRFRPRSASRRPAARSASHDEAAHYAPHTTMPVRPTLGSATPGTPWPA